MATRARFGYVKDGIIKSVYHHWDGYPSWLGERLEKYDSLESLEELMSGGDISSIEANLDWDREEINPPRPLYFNERGEKTKPIISHNLLEFGTLCNNYGCEHAYLFDVKNKTWSHYKV